MPTGNNSEFWKRKLAAYLHDPPEKCYDFSPEHERRAQMHAGSFGVADLWSSLIHQPDWSASAADRFIFPSGQRIDRSLGENTRPCFIHPLSGRDNTPSLPSDSLKYPSQADAEEWLGDIRPDWKSDDPQTLFLRAWRHWSTYVAEHPKGRGEGAELLPYLPADTRVVDGSIWHHCAVVSALEGTRTSDDPKAELKPAFLLFQVGPVQDFIAQARSTRDLWSGSYLLSWLTMHAIKAVADHCGPDAIIFPSLKGQPLYDFLEQQRLGLENKFDNGSRQHDVLVPGIPNRFLALVPANFDVKGIVSQAFRREWESIATACHHWLKEKGITFAGHYDKLWQQQIANHWQLTWQLWSWQPADKALAAFEQIPLGRDNPIHRAKKIAESIPDADKDNRCYRGGKLDPGWAWSAHYQLCQHALDARRAVRDFPGLPTDLARKPGHRDALSGREEAVVQADALQKALQSSPELGYLFRHIEPLGAANIVKRVWHKAYLDRLKDIEGEKRLSNLTRARESFDSVPSVAAGGWIFRLRQRLSRNEDLWLRLIDVSEVLHAAAPHLKGISIKPPINKNSHITESRWLDETESEVFTENFWNQLDPEISRLPQIAAAAASVRDLKKQFALGNPSSYYAVLALDGDQIGRWLSGEKSPAVQKVISTKAADYFREKVNDQDVDKWLSSPRPISPSWHLQFSEALAHFGLHAARRIVEDVHHGQLIYSGGDDVLAMLPAEEAIACAINLRAAFQGSRSAMSEECKALFKPEAPEGFIWLQQPRAGEPTWPLLVPGPKMTVSVGIAIGHVKEPLQDMIHEAQTAEKRAKANPEKEIFDRSDSDLTNHSTRWKYQEGWGRDAIAVTLFKRSGETIRWGAKFGSAAFPLLALFQKYYRPPAETPGLEMPISSKFPHRVAELLGKFGQHTNLTPGLAEIANAEFAWITRQQMRQIGPIQSEPQLGELRDQLCERAAAYLRELREFAWERPTVNGQKSCVNAPRHLSDFTNLFLLEAFISRQAD